MGEVFIRCTFGQKKKDGRVVRPGSCTNRASGAFRVHFVRGKPRISFLCAACAFDKVPNHVVCLPPPEDAAKGTPNTYFRDVHSIELLVTFGTVYDQTGVPRAVGYKHWVERRDQMRERKTVMEVVKVYPPRGKKMDLDAYRQSLTRHDDGK